ncbi:MAG TPA: D-alanyl-D-alanine carboxypeptidase, partial [Flavisolibacter sp.]|nr:D-alanyl-D-alanine carboxypeptidase [Flavisolibacter sp.]
PLRTSADVISALLKDTLNAEVTPSVMAFGHRDNPVTSIVHSQPTDSLLKPMMHRSDNFFAEQALLMVSNEVLGFMNDEKIIDTLLKTIYADLPQKPRWVDGSGLSRYNLFTPQDFVTILRKMQIDFGPSRVREILPTGNEGTLRNYYKADSSFLYAKTGTLSGVVALSGFLTTGKGKELIFSVLVNNHNASATQVRRAVEAFLQNLRNRY